MKDHTQINGNTPSNGIDRYIKVGGVMKIVQGQTESLMMIIVVFTLLLVRSMLK